MPTPSLAELLQGSNLPRRHILADGVYEALGELLFDQRLPPGARMNIDRLAEELGVSATPVREALARLAADGLVVKVPHRGYIAQPLIDRSSFEKMYEARLILEPAAARLAAEHASDELVTECERLTVTLQTAWRGSSYRESKGFSVVDATFHRTIAQASANPHVSDAIERLRSHLHLSRLYAVHGIVDADDAIADHVRITKALRSRDAPGAEKAMRDHISRSQSRLREILDEIQRS